ncbi:hypothetical protein [Ktedonospora formicarum]|uniref:hypothetical protein n=1 Tax=Ktedonospora formicarum TaxID=2778364 RepID=UPI001C6926EA|nr:hypothetical protein [Ktedonospora formicarum]
MNHGSVEALGNTSAEVQHDMPGGLHQRAGLYLKQQLGIFVRRTAHIHACLAWTAGAM